MHWYKLLSIGFIIGVLLSGVRCLGLWLSMGLGSMAVLWIASLYVYKACC